MSILEKYSAAIKNKDEAVMNDLLHDDFKFTMHKSGNVLGKGDVIKWAMSGDINQDKVRVVYENDEVGVHHSFVTFDDGNVEAVMAVYKYDNGKIVSLETGATPMPKWVSGIDFYFSIGSTYTYLSVTRILDVEKEHQVKFNWKPFSVRAIMKEMNNIPFPKDKINKVNYMWRDIERRAEGYGFFAKTPVPYPLSEFDLANQIAILGFDKGWGEKFVMLTYKKWFQEGKEPAIEPSISEVCAELNLNKDKIISESNSEIIEIKYNENTNSARENKIFGSPSFIVKNEVFWGDDRMEDAIKWSLK